MNAGQLGTLLVGIGTLITSITSAAMLLMQARRGSDRESKRAVVAAIEAVTEVAVDVATEQPPPPTPIDQHREGRHERG